MAISAPPFTVKALYSYESDHPDDLTFTEGQVIEVTAIEDDEWFNGSYSGKAGMFPRNFVEIIARPAPAAPARPAPKHVVPDLSAPLVTETTGKSISEEGPKAHVTENVTGDKFEAQQQTSHDKPILPIEEQLSEMHVSEKTGDEQPAPKSKNAFKDRIAAFNTTAASLVPKTVKQTSFIQKPYEPPARSSYIPPSFSNEHSAPATSQPRSPTPPAPEEHEEEAPKMSLKERIAMLQKEQERMHAEAEAALEKKKAKSKAKKEAKNRQDGHIEPAMSGNSMSSMVGTTTGDSMTRSVTGESVISGHEIGPTETEVSEYGPQSETAEEREEEGDDEKEVNDKDEDEEEDEEEEDEEEAKRIALRERMAKLSGGAGMNLGMIMTGGLGMPLPSKKITRAKPKSVEEESDESYTPVQQVPMLPFTDANATVAVRKETLPPIPARSPPRSASLEDDDLSSEEEDEDSSSARGPFRRSSKSDLPVTESGDADEEVTTTQPEETSDDGFHSGSRPVSQSSVTAPPKAVPPRLPSFDSHRPLGVVSDDELGDDEKTEPEESHHSSSATSPNIRRRSYIGGSGVPPPIPMSPPESRRLTSENRSLTMPETSEEHSPKMTKRQSTFVPTSHPPPPPRPPHPAVVSSDVLEEDTSDEDTGYEADIDMDKIPVAPNTRPPPPPPPVTIPENREHHRESESHVISPSRPLPPSAPPAPPSGGHSSQDWIAPAQPSTAPSISSRTERKSIDRMSLDHQMGRASIDQVTRTSLDHQTGQTNSGRKTSTDKRRSIDRGGSRLSLDRGASLATAREINDLQLDSEWYLKPSAVPSAISEAAANGDVIYEVEDNETSKRGGRKMITRDVYILHRDYSQTTITVRFEAHDPAGTVSSEQSHERAPEISQDVAEREWEKFGKHIYELASRGATNPGQFGPDEFVRDILGKIPDIVPSIGRRIHGIPVYDNLANATVKQLDEIRPGDVVSFKNAKLQGHKGSLHQKYSQEAGANGTIHLGFVSEWDGTKQKMRVLEQVDGGRKIRLESYRLGDLKSGEIVVFRVVGRQFVGWA